MAKQGNQKLKALVLCQVLLERTDEDHPMTTAQLIEELARWDIHAERKSIYADLEALEAFGLDIQCRKGKVPGWFIGQRPFELAELKLLVDAVQSSKFITSKKSAALIAKLEGLTSRHSARQLQRQVYVDRRVKTMNESIYYTVDKLHAALDSGKMVSFKYFDYDMDRGRTFRREGGRYAVSPFGLVWDHENYYLVGHDSHHDETRHYRVDKMAELTVTCAPRVSPPVGFDLATYGGRHFGMYSGTAEKVTLRFDARLANVVFDRFGQDVILIPDGKDHFTVTLDVVVSPQFFGWLFGLGGGVTITAPVRVRDQFTQALTGLLSRYSVEPKK